MSGLFALVVAASAGSIGFSNSETEHWVETCSEPFCLLFAKSIKLLLGRDDIGYV